MEGGWPTDWVIFSVGLLVVKTQGSSYEERAVPFRRLMGQLDEREVRAMGSTGSKNDLCEALCKSRVVSSTAPRAKGDGRCTTAGGGGWVSLSR
jgi:hypothetical protein